MGTKLYTYNKKQYIVTHISDGEAIVRPFPLAETEQVEFLPYADLKEVGEVELHPVGDHEKPNISQRTPKQLPSSSQSSPNQLPPSGQSTPNQKTANARAAKPDFDPLAHYLQHYYIVEAILDPEFYRDSKSAADHRDLHKLVKFPRPVQRALNKHFSFVKSRDFYMKLYKIHLQVEVARLPWFIEITDRFIISLMQKLFTA